MGEAVNTDLLREYGAFETNTLADTGISHDNTEGEMDWTDEDLDAIIRIRLLSDPGFPFWDVSYVLGRAKNGSQVRVHVPFYQLSKKGYMGEMYRAARADGIHLNTLCGGHVRDVLSRLI